MSKNGDFNVIGGIATKISSFQKIFVKLGETKFKDFFYLFIGVLRMSYV